MKLGIYVARRPIGARRRSPSRCDSAGSGPKSTATASSMSTVTPACRALCLSGRSSPAPWLRAKGVYDNEAAIGRNRKGLDSNAGSSFTVM